MTLYCELSVAAHIFFGVCTLLLMIGAVLVLVSACVFHLRCRYLLLSSALLLAVMFMFQGITDVSLEQMHRLSYVFFSDIIGSLPCIAVILLMLLSAAAEVIFLSYILKVKKNMLTPGAIKESLDALPDGVCFYSSDGQPLLVNMQMNKISGELFGTEIMNAEDFRLNLQAESSGGKARIISAEPTLVIQTGDEKVWDFRHNILSVSSSEVQELVAFDVTEQYNLNKELEIRNKRLSGVNERLRKYSSEIEHVTAEKEILAAKIRVHDDVGRSLLAFRSYLAKPMSELNREDLLLLWRYTISVMKKETVTVAQSNDWELLLKAAEAVDVKIELRGELPEKGNIRAVITAAIHECLTNTVKHAKGNRLYLNIKSSDTSLTAEITNNGEQPKGEIKETGGLKNLRHTAESAGGAMTVESTPRFLLRLDFQKGDEI